MPPLFQQPASNLYRLVTGRLPSRQYAEQLAQRIYEETGYRPYIGQLAGGGYRLMLGPTEYQNIAKQMERFRKYGFGYTEAFKPSAPMTQADAARQAVTNLINTIFERATQPFNYNPANDPVFQTASQAAQRQVMEAMNERGILNSTITADRAAQAVGELAAQFMEQAFQRRMADIEALSNLLSPLINQYQYERSFPLAEAELTGTYNGRMTLPAQQQLLAFISDLARAWGVPSGIGRYVPGPAGDILNRYGNLRMSLPEILRNLAQNIR